MRKHTRYNFNQRLSEVQNADLKHMYEVRQMTINAIRIFFNVHATVINAELKRRGISIRTKGGNRKTHLNETHFAELKHLYLEKGYSIDRLSRHFKSNSVTISRLLRELNIPVRSRGGIHKYKDRISKIDLKEVKHLYEVKRFTITALARHYKINSVTMSTLCMKAGVKLRTSWGGEKFIDSPPKKKDGLNYHERMIY